MVRPKEYKGLIYRKEGKRATITWNRPEILNALAAELYWETAWALMEAESDPEVEVVVITGAGRAFSAGGDLKQCDQLHQEGLGRMVGHIFGTPSYMLFSQLERMDKLVICSVNGLAHGAASITVICADLAVASEQATFRLPEALSGISMPYTGTRLALRVGMARAKKMIFTAEEVDAHEAVRIGLVNQVVPHSQLAAATDTLVDQVLATEMNARGWYKQAMRTLFPAFDPRAQIETVGSLLVAEQVHRFANKKGVSAHA